MLFKRTIKLIYNIHNQTQCRNNGHVAFIGVGQMGARMANNLIKNDTSVKVFDVLPENAKSIQGAQFCATPQEAAKGASVVITMLPNGDIVKSAITGDKGVLGVVPKNSLVIDCSTIEPKVAQECAKAAKESGVRFLDAPVSGGVTGAQAATLTFMVGGDVKDMKEAEPTLLKMGKKVFHCGQSGAGQIAKLCNNLILGVTMIGTCEGLNLGIKAGLDPKTLVDIVNVSSGRSWSSDTYNPVPGIMENVPATYNYDGGFVVGLVAKDLGLAEGVALTLNAPVPLAATAHQLYRVLIANGFAKKDLGYVYQFFKGNQ